MVAIVNKNTQDIIKPIQKNIMKDRSKTDKYWIYLFFVVFAIWLGSCGYLRYVKHNLELLDINDHVSDKNETTEKEDFISRSIFNMARLEEHSKEFGPMVVYLNLALYGTLLISTTLAIFLRVYHKYCGHCLIICIGIQIVSFIYRATMYLSYGSSTGIIPWDDRFLCWNIPEFVAFSICVQLIFIVAIRKGMNTMSESIWKAIRFYKFHMQSLIFGIFIILIMGCLILFTLGTIKGIGTKNISMAFPIVILIGSSYLLLTTYFFGVAVVSLTTANNYWMPNGNKITFEDVDRAINMIVKYHFGTICFNATGILPLFVALHILVKSIYQSIRSKSNVSKKYMMVAFFFFIDEYSTIITAISGKNFYDATKRFIHLPIEARRVAKNLRENQMIWMIIGLIIISVNNLLLIFKWMFNEDDPYFTQTALFSYITIIYIFMPVALILDVIMDTILFCGVEKNEAINSIPANTLVELPSDVTIAK